MLFKQHVPFLIEAACTSVAWNAASDMRHFVLTVAITVLQGCLAVSTIVYRILGKDLVDVLYAATHEDLQGCRLMQVAMLALQLQLHEVRLHILLLLR